MSSFALESPVGLLFVEVTPDGLRRIELLSRGRDLGGTRAASETVLGGTGTSRPLDGAETRIAEVVEAQMREYFGGERRDFDLPLDLDCGSEFQRQIWRATADIPYGSVMSYAELAIAAGYPNAFRAAGSACGANPVPIVTPCHRVIASGGRLGGYGVGLETKVWLLRHEGVGCDDVDRAARVRMGSLLGV